MKNKTDFKNIIFDFGGVIINIDPLLPVKAFRELGIKNIEDHYSAFSQGNLFDELEKGTLSAAEFRNRIRKSAGISLTDENIDQAWNSILVDLPVEHVEFLEKLKSRYRLFLLSNTNEIHERTFTEMIRKKYGENVLEKVFERVYFSHHLKMRKPDPEIFRYVLKENSLVASETLFLDDSPQHLEGAKQVGLHTFHFKDWKTFMKNF